MLILKPLTNGKSQRGSVQEITTPTDLYMKQDTLNEKLMPIGKFKGEMNGGLKLFTWRWTEQENCTRTTHSNIQRGPTTRRMDGNK